MNEFKQKGTLLDKTDVKIIGDKGNKKRTFRLAIKEEWTSATGSGERIETPEFVAWNERCDQLDAIRIGDEVEVEFKLSGSDRTYRKDGVEKTWRSTELKAQNIALVFNSATPERPFKPNGQPDKDGKYTAVTSDPALLGDDYPPQDDDQLPF